MSDASDIEAQAAAWVARGDARETDDDMDLRAWLLADPRHRAAYLRLAEAWSRTEQLARLRPTRGPIDADLLAPPRTGWRRLRSVLPRPRVQVAAVALAALGMLVWWNLSPRANSRVVRTGPSGLLRIELADGTVVTLNANTDLRVHYQRTLRTVTLLRGEAQFQVVHDNSWPFQVTVNGHTLRDVGTVFDVRREDARTVDVMVERGRVAVLPAAGSLFVDGNELPLLCADDLAVLTQHHVAVRHASHMQIEQALRWERRPLYFRGETLRRAVAEFNRHNYRKIVIATPALGRIRIGGTFRTFAVHSFVAALRRSFNIRERPGPHHTIQLYRAADSGRQHPRM